MKSIMIVVICCGIQLSKTEDPEPPMLQKKTWRRVNGEKGKGAGLPEKITHGNLHIAKL